MGRHLQRGPGQLPSPWQNAGSLQEVFRLRIASYGFFEGSPTALHMTGKLFGEPELLLLAHAFQSRTDHHLKHPPLR